MHRFKHGTLRSGSKKLPKRKRPKVTNPKQAVAIMMSEKRAEAAGKGHRKRSRAKKR